MNKLSSTKDSYQAWKQEYQSNGLPTSKRTRPSRAAIDILDYVVSAGFKLSRLLELGCGIGRNASYFAEHGYTIQGLDFIETLSEKFYQLAQIKKVREKVQFTAHDLRKGFPFENHSFDMIYGMTVLENLVNDNEINFLKFEIQRVLNPQGIFAIYFLTDADGFYGPRIQPGKGSGKLVWAEDNGMWQRVFNRKEIEGFFEQGFRQVFHKAYSFPDNRYETVYQRELELLIFNKK